MVNGAVQLEKLRMLLDNEKAAYRQAIEAGRKFSEAKAIYLRIKALEKLLPLITQGLLS